MAEVHWTEPALDDLRDISDFVARDSPAYAARLSTKLVEATRRLAQFPRIGSVVPELQQDEIRELWVRPYRIIYVLRAEHCYIAAIVHGNRDLSGLLHRDDLPGT
jgi:plasmid stabilization system protein ParE